MDVERPGDLSASYDRATTLDVMRRGNIRPSGVAAVLLVDVAAHARHHFVHTDSSGCRVIGQPRRISWHSPRSKNRR